MCIILEYLAADAASQRILAVADPDDVGFGVIRHHYMLSNIYLLLM